MKEKIAQILRDNITFSSPIGDYHGAVDEIEELLKQERNKAIDEVIELIPIALDSNMTLSEIIKALEYLKVKANES